MTSLARTLPDVAHGMTPRCRQDAKQKTTPALAVARVRTGCGMPSISDTLPESQQALRVIARFFSEHLELPSPQLRRAVLTRC
ncbi:hypothetical protein [Xanthomonas citri]|uniref:hypothetical protein n=1 Tax=Xanthomonas citri TaxID=346 RepID=UPI00155B303B|nr:hypothetical protein [Xanthomonas citri]MDS0759393.1 hypothetical protein [Xanthomonas citri pv. punicae]MDS0763168.1 hypothetical protein [Xanthomonas citri pv. punicae]MDS0797939.1 hypothetical protein [Xanthomonas citri pv. punicae]MDS0830574.1 hypothetical protein [Xanthomonas citri pv. punicae]MDS0834382.1 hypothetical protein [Xanthomonas citri pv. punicae]